jgi:hypothetical protein
MTEPLDATLSFDEAEEVAAVAAVEAAFLASLGKTPGEAFGDGFDAGVAYGGRPKRGRATDEGASDNR